MGATRSASLRGGLRRGAGPAPRRDGRDAGSPLRGEIPFVAAVLLSILVAILL